MYLPCLHNANGEAQIFSLSLGSPFVLENNSECRGLDGKLHDIPVSTWSILADDEYCRSLDRWWHVALNLIDKNTVLNDYITPYCREGLGNTHTHRKKNKNCDHFSYTRQICVQSRRADWTYARVWLNSEHLFGNAIPNASSAVLSQPNMPCVENQINIANLATELKVKI